MRILRGMLALLLIAVVTLIQQQTVFAQSSQSSEGITLSPAVSKPMLKSGVVYRDKLKVINNGQTEYTLHVYAAPFSVKDEAYDPDFVTINERTRAFEWVDFDVKILTLKAGESIEVPYTVNVPDNVAPGGHYAVLFVETQPREGSQIARKKRVGNLLYMTTEGKTELSGRLQEMEVPSFHTKKPVTTNIRISNSGNTHFEAKLRTVYKGLFGKKHLTYNQEVIIMPGTTRRVPMIWENPPYLGVFKVSSEVEYLGATEQLNAKYIVILPIPVIAAVLTLVFALILSFVLRRRKKGNGRGYNASHNKRV